MRHPTPKFSEFVTWIKEKKIDNDHWRTTMDSCYPCAHDWDAILHIETMENDSALLIDHLKPDINNFPVRHSHAKEPVTSHFWKRIPEFDDVPDDVVDYFLNLYKTDMEMFGYKWDKINKVAYCAIETASGYCC